MLAEVSVKHLATVRAGLAKMTSTMHIPIACNTNEADSHPDLRVSPKTVMSSATVVPASAKSAPSLSLSLPSISLFRLCE